MKRAREFLPGMEKGAFHHAARIRSEDVLENPGMMEGLDRFRSAPGICYTRPLECATRLTTKRITNRRNAATRAITRNTARNRAPSHIRRGCMQADRQTRRANCTCFPGRRSYPLTEHLPESV